MVPLGEVPIPYATGFSAPKVLKSNATETKLAAAPAPIRTAMVTAIASDEEGRGKTFSAAPAAVIIFAFIFILTKAVYKSRVSSCNILESTAL